MTTLVLLSGGVDSTTLLYQLRQGGAAPALRALFMDYGQRAAAREHAAVAHHCRALDVALTTLDLSAVGHAFRAEQTHKLHVPLPHRNIVVVALALSFAAQTAAAHVYLALNREDAHGYASAAPAFLAAMRAAAQALSGPQLLTPLVDMDKAEIVRRGHALGIDFAQTYSCLLGHARHCGSCGQCRQRRAAFAAAGVGEARGFYRNE